MTIKYPPIVVAVLTLITIYLLARKSETDNQIRSYLTALQNQLSGYAHENVRKFKTGLWKEMEIFFQPETQSLTASAVKHGAGGAKPKPAGASADWISKNLVAPNKLPLNLANAHKADYSQFGQSKTMMEKYLKLKRNGRYLEVGAADGEWISNSLSFEEHLNWTGILIETAMDNFEKLKTKNRNAYLLNACLSDVKEPTPSFIGPAKSGVGSLLYEVGKKKKSTDGRQVMCIPLQAVFDVLGWDHLDLMCLDVEGKEPDVLRTIDFDRMKIDFFQIECNNCRTSNKKELDTIKEILLPKGYELMEILKIDWVFKRKAI